MVTGPGPYYAPLADLDRDAGASAISTIICGLPSPSPSTPSAGCGPAARCCSWAAPAAAAAGPGLSLIAAGTAALPALIANLAVEVAPIRVNLIAAGFVDTPLSASLLGDDLEQAPRSSCAPRCPSGASSARPTSPRSRCTS